MSDIKNILKHRPNRIAKGFTKQEENRKAKGKTRIGNPVHPNFNHIVNTLVVRGTLDELGAGYWMFKKRVIINHPTDAGFKKEVFVLSELGKNKLKRLKQKKARAV